MSDTPNSVTPVESSPAPNAAIAGDNGVEGTLTSPENKNSEPGAIAKLYQDLHRQCGEILDLSVNAEFGQLQAQSHVFLYELESWAKAISPNREEYLVGSAAREYQFALLALVQGHYRYAFKGLRLVLELCLQAVHLSTHRLELQEWLENRKDTVWGVLIEEENGVLSPRYARAFFPELVEHVRQHRSLAEQLYRECSECVHGNVDKYVSLPRSLAFTADAFRLWHEKAKLVAMIVTFVLALRYLHELSDSTAFEQDLLSRLGHIVAIRRHFGGTEGG